MGGWLLENDAGKVEQEDQIQRVFTRRSVKKRGRI